MENIEKLSEEEENFVINNYPIIGGVACAKELNCKLNMIKNIVKAHNLRVQDGARSNILINARLKVQQNYLDNNKTITPQSITNTNAYALGFLWGDGYLLVRDSVGLFKQNMMITIVKEDFIQIQNELCSIGGRWNISDRTRDSRKTTRDGYLYDKEWNHFLYENEYHRKSEISPAKILDYINSILHFYFWRGYIDADGCFYVNLKKSMFQFALAGSYQQNWSSFEKLLISLDVTYRIARRQQFNKASNNISQYSQVRITGKSNIIKLIAYLYPDFVFDFGLKRKYDKAMIIVNDGQTRHSRRC